MTQFKLVPVEPGEDMLVAGQEEWALGTRGALEDCEEAGAIYRAMLAAAPSPWVSVGERLPEEEKDSTESDIVIVCLNDLVRTTGFYCHVENEWYGEDGYSFEDASNGSVTHWMPLPTPPATQESNE